MRTSDLVIVGGGPAGISAAISAAEIGASVALIDDSPEPGGKVLKPGRTGVAIRHTNRIEAMIGRRLMRQFDQVRSRIRLYPNSEVWDVSSDNTVAFSVSTGKSERLEEAQGRALIFCTGALERTLPFPGWTLPGVFTVGGLNTLIKRGVVPGRNFIIAGAGPLQMVLAHNLLKAGARIKAMITTVSPRDVAARALGLTAGIDPLKFAAGLRYFYTLKRNKVPIFPASAITRARGNGELTSAILQKVDRSWVPVPGSGREIRADAVAVGYGLIPATELTRLRGCRHVFDDTLGYWRVERSATLETSVCDVFAAGDGVTVKGYSAAALEGRIAATEACAQLGSIPRSEADQKTGPLLRRLRKAACFGKALDILFRPMPGLLKSIPADTIVCRCEDVTAADIREAVDQGAGDINDIKRKTRLGMGPCQGRFCGQVVNELLWMMTDKPTPHPRQVFTPRSPVRPVTFGVLADTLNQEREDHP